MEGLKANKRKINYKKGIKTKNISFSVSKRELIRVRREEEEEEEEGGAKKGMDSSMELYGTWFCMESCVFWTLVGISMVSKPRV